MLVTIDTTGCTTFVESSSTSHADFEDDRPDVPSGEMEEAHRRRDLEERRATIAVMRVFDLESLDRLSDVVDQLNDLGFRGRVSVDGEPFLEAMQVRRTIQAGGHARGRQYRGHHRRRGAFPLRARDVDDRQTRLGIAQPLEEAPHPPERQLRRDTRHSLPLVIQAMIEVIEAFLIVGHHWRVVRVPLLGSSSGIH